MDSTHGKIGGKTESIGSGTTDWAKLDWFETLILPHEPALRSRMRRLNPHVQDLDDLVSEVLTRAYANPRWHEVGSGRAYLYAIARNLMIDLARRQKVVAFEALMEWDTLDSGHDLSAQLCARSQLRRLAKVLDSLPPQPRRVFVMRRIHEKSCGEIAEELGLSVSTVEKHLGYALRVFMGELARQDEEVNAVDIRHRSDAPDAGRDSDQTSDRSREPERRGGPRGS
jgi:RNA polymerase sigma-70 factor (ECF subfamily)